MLHAFVKFMTTTDPDNPLVHNIIKSMFVIGAAGFTGAVVLAIKEEKNRKPIQIPDNYPTILEMYGSDGLPE